MRDYIAFNTENRKQASNEFKKDEFKLMTNSVFGKTIENLRNMVKIEPVTIEKRVRKLIKAPPVDQFQDVHTSHHGS